ncbi:uncharacterized protein G6M90_00g051340 [Metarhizium brunneum]|uniref:Uncharacterized protein n=1 Tax=Metarhizium brunneum TaxID=500148 RepID=A0A7D5UW20_9HYPO|nr:hypothetical protein G6M90_00g051340 [Metarhizium brunneum]
MTIAKDPNATSYAQPLLEDRLKAPGDGSLSGTRRNRSGASTGEASSPCLGGTRG